MFAAGKQRGEHAEVGIGEEPAFRRASDGACGAHNRSQVLAAGHGVEMFRADSRQAGNFIIGESLLSGFDGDHIVYPSRFPGPFRFAIKRN